MTRKRELRSAPATSDQHPFGDFIQNRLGKKNVQSVRKLFSLYDAMQGATGQTKLIDAICDMQEFVDGNLQKWPKLLGGNVTPFSTFRGAFLEEVTLLAARYTVKQSNLGHDLEVTKLATGAGLVSGLSLAYRRGKLGNQVPLVLRRDREDVIVGFRRSLVLAGSDGAQAVFRDEIIPICIIACKIYVDATRLENVLAKAKNLYAHYATSSFLVVAEWDALGHDWHDDQGRVLDSLFAPVEAMVFLRGEEARRPPNAALKKESMKNPYQRQQIKAVIHHIESAIQSWAE
ncbi:MAG TPA: hypothetical protein VGM05_17405 [Planctomycetaceae bacterium]|jgi:hypothetical protein